MLIIFCCYELVSFVSLQNCDTFTVAPSITNDSLSCSNKLARNKSPYGLDVYGKWHGSIPWERQGILTKKEGSVQMVSLLR